LQEKKEKRGKKKTQKGHARPFADLNAKKENSAGEPRAHQANTLGGTPSSRESRRKKKETKGSIKKKKKNEKKKQTEEGRKRVGRKKTPRASVLGIKRDPAGKGTKQAVGGKRFFGTRRTGRGRKKAENGEGNQAIAATLWEGARGGGGVTGSVKKDPGERKSHVMGKKPDGKRREAKRNMNAAGGKKKTAEKEGGSGWWSRPKSQGKLRGIRNRSLGSPGAGGKRKKLGKLS